jgi:hypothetical protein
MERSGRGRREAFFNDMREQLVGAVAGSFDE